MKKTLIRLLALSSFALVPFSSHAIEVALEGGLSFDTPTMSSTNGGAAPSLTSKSSIAYGLFAGYSMFPGFQLESGVMLLPRSFSQTDGLGNLANTEFKSYMIPVMMRFTLLPLISIGGGAYYATGTGNVSSTVTLTGGGGTVSGESDFNTAGIKKSGYGALASVRLGLPLAPLVHLLVDGRYLMDLSERSTDATESLKFKDLQVLGGISIGF